MYKIYTAHHGYDERENCKEPYITIGYDDYRMTGRCYGFALTVPECNGWGTGYFEVGDLFDTLKTARELMEITIFSKPWLLSEGVVKHIEYDWKREWTEDSMPTNRWKFVQMNTKTREILPIAYTEISL